MSGLIKAVKKVFKAVVKVIKKILPIVLIAVAVYFTAGLALSAFPATAGFAASMPGFAGGGFLGLGVGAGATAGTGIFSQVASAIGLGGGLAKGALVGSELLGVGAASVGEVAGIFGAEAATAGMLAHTVGPGATLAEGTTASVLGGGASGIELAGAAGGAVAGGAAAGAGAGLIAPATAGAGMSLTDKLLLTKVGTDVAGALFGPTPQEEAEATAVEQKKFRGAFYGIPEGATGPAPAPTVTPQPAPTPPQGTPTPAQAPTGFAQPPGAITPEQQQLLDGRKMREELFPTANTTPPGQSSGPGQMQSNIPIPQGLFAATPNVRYI